MDLQGPATAVARSGEAKHPLPLFGRERLLPVARVEAVPFRDNPDLQEVDRLAVGRVELAVTEGETVLGMQPFEFGDAALGAPAGTTGLPTWPIADAAAFVCSKRTEILILNYMREHLHPSTSYRIPCIPGAVTAGFPSPTDDYMDGKLDLNEHLIIHPAATFYCRVSGSSMEGVGIFDGDLLNVDWAVEPKYGSVVVEIVDGEMSRKILDRVRAASFPRTTPICRCPSARMRTWPSRGS